ncbi:DgyrCDS2388 [Dimorphilus gyrociliatus]|uniref:DgyrCDS2388 n=1 Tax=Dimorphilus gyrociliatus TaxID=2664684 RepID=A0A7I8VAD7_9ANNE|nr:DgyrCDS2388 [Dimorphilus gyrociliatus]
MDEEENNGEPSSSDGWPSTTQYDQIMQITRSHYISSNQYENQAGPSTNFSVSDLNVSDQDYAVQFLIPNGESHILAPSTSNVSSRTYSDTSEASPLVHSLDRLVKSHGLDSFQNEPDTTQEDSQDHLSQIQAERIIAEAAISDSNAVVDSSSGVLDSTVSQSSPNIDACQPSTTLDASIDTTMKTPNSVVQARIIENSDLVITCQDSDIQSTERKAKRGVGMEDFDGYFRVMEYNVNQFWCQDCSKYYDEECLIHNILSVPDKPVDSKARATCPAQLCIGKIDGQEGVGLFAKKKILKRTRFGPFEAEYERESDGQGFILPIEDSETKNIVYIQATDESICNWMMFVRPATDHRHQNLMAYQHGGHIYYNALRDIDVREELRVWYAPPYAARWDFELLKVDHEGIAESDKKYKCFECSASFETPSKFEAHLSQHEAEEEREEARLKVSLKGKRGRNKDNDYIQANLKKRKSSIYLNRLSRDSVKRSLRRVQQRRVSCSVCNMAFDDTRILSIHATSHEEHPVESIDYENLTCPVCNKTFVSHGELVEHTTSHARVRLSMKKARFKPFTCSTCLKKFTTHERLEAHRKVHTGGDEVRPLTCSVCKRKLMNNSALACHMKTHSSDKFFDCPICDEKFDQVHNLKVHVKGHSVNGCYFCPKCPKKFTEYVHIRKHMKAVHGDKCFQCSQCPKSFPRADKLRLHMLVHSDKKEFMCDQCGRQFKRKDKLKDHTARIHNADRKPRHRIGTSQRRSNQQDDDSELQSCRANKVPPTEYQRYVYKCETCMLGFKRRGMLVNHLAKRHPQMSIEEVPELTYPILKTQRDYYCQYCDKTYKSSSKRKAHILKHHPGQELPPSGRHSTMDEGDNTFSTPVGNMTVTPHACNMCHKQYASRAKLFQHQRKDHPQHNLAPPLLKKKATKLPTDNQTQLVGQILVQDGTGGAGHTLLVPQHQFVFQNDQGTSDQLQLITFNGNDLLQQAVCEAISPDQRLNVLQLQQFGNENTITLKSGNEGTSTLTHFESQEDNL